MSPSILLWHGRVIIVLAAGWSCGIILVQIVFGSGGPVGYLRALVQFHLET
jgi:hypothetical protein